MRLHLTLAQKGMITVSLMLVFELLFAAALVQMLNHSGEKLKRAGEVRQVISHLNKLMHIYNQSIVGLFRVIQHQVVTNETEAQSRASVDLQEQYYGQSKIMQDELRAITDLVHDDPVAYAAIVEITKDSQKGLVAMEECRQCGFERKIIENISEGTKLSSIGKRVIRRENQLLKYYTDLEAEISAQEAHLRELTYLVITILVLFNIVVALATAFFFTRNITGRLNILGENSVRLAVGEELFPVLAGTDEIAKLDQAFHGMAETLDEATRKERAIVENATDLICSIGKDGRFSAVNSAVQAMLGYTSDELLGQRFFQIVADEHKTRTKGYLDEVAKTGKSLPFETQLMRVNGEMIFAIWSAQWSNKDQTWFSVIHDISERKREENLIKASEERIRSVIENLPVGVVTTDANGLVESINRMTSEMFSVRADELLNRPVTSLFENQIDPKSSMKELQPGKTIEQTAKRSNGETFPVELTTAEYQGFEGNRLLIHIKDITERQEIERLKQEFIAMISHDLRTPLTSIGGTLTLIQEGIYGDMSDGGLKRVTDAQRNVERLINLVSDLLDLEKLEAGRLTMELEQCDIAEIIDSSVASVKSYADQKGVTLHAKTSGATINADSDRLIQVLVNLMSNAVKFSPVGGNVYVWSFQDSDNGHVTLQVKDEGRGIPKEFHESIFERFQQVEVGDGKRSMGSGLGLAICKAIVESHKGTIGVASDGATGSTFWIRLPAAPTSQ